MAEYQCPVHHCERVDDRIDITIHFATHSLYEQKYAILRYIEMYEPKLLTDSNSDDPFEKSLEEQYIPAIEDHPVFTMEMVEGYFGSIRDVVGETKLSTGNTDFVPPDAPEYPSEREMVLRLNHYDKDKYGPNWSEQRRLVLERDDLTCRVCGLDYQDGEYKIQVHHITPAREFHSESGDANYEQMNKLSNLVTLCGPCHGTYEGRWTNVDHKQFVQNAKFERE